jgi:cyclic pyranopterin phosphate synthase
MIDIQGKKATDREAVAVGRIHLNARAIAALKEGTLPKGDALAAARIAGIAAAKRTPELIPFCHPIPLSYVDLEFEVDVGQGKVAITAIARAHAPTGVEMEALTAVSVAALTIHDMCKAVDPAAEIQQVCVVRKTGGKTGPWERKASS